MKNAVKEKLAGALAAALVLSLVFSVPTVTEDCFLFPELTAASAKSSGEGKESGQTDGFIPRWFLGELLERLFGV